MTRKGNALIVLLIFTMCFSQVAKGVKIFNVKNFGALGDDHFDSTQAFNKTWNEACKWRGSTVIEIPRGIYLLRNIQFFGPCLGPINFHNEGTLKAHNVNIGLYYWTEFKYIDQLHINGGGSFDGQGSDSWKLSKIRPISVVISFVNNSRIDNVTSINSKGSHFKLYGCKNITISRISIHAPSNSPNTDGINIAISTQIQVLDSKISTGDDCVSLLPGAEDVNITGTHCGPGHGISIGSMGGSPYELPVKGIHVKNCNFTNTQNGVRIKTRATKMAGTIVHASFENILVDNVYNPIIIDQNYCPEKHCQKGDSHVEISNVKFVNIVGVSRSQVAVNFKCSQYKPCQVETSNINLKYRSKEKPTLSTCKNVRIVSSGYQMPPSCSSKLFL